jgi:PD-(D/E)XK nuclease superfamily
MNHGEHGEHAEGLWGKRELRDCDESLIDAFSKIHLAQVMNYLKLLGFKRGYLLNFNVKLLKEGIKRVSI